MTTLTKDLRGFLPFLRRTPRTWIPFGPLAVSFVVGLLLDQLPEAVQRPAALFVQLTLPPTALFVFLLGGLLALRRGYLMGAALGLVDGILWVLFVSLYGDPNGTILAQLIDALVIIAIATAVGLIAGGLAGIAMSAALGRPWRGSPPYAHHAGWTRDEGPAAAWGPGVGPPPGWYGPPIPSAELPDVLLRTYDGDARRIRADRATDAAALAERGYVVLSERAAPKPRGLGAWLVATLLIFYLIGIVLIAWYLLRPLSTVEVTYRRRQRPV